LILAGSLASITLPFPEDLQGEVPYAKNGTSANQPREKKIGVFEPGIHEDAS
jgi:hypothetical protein